MKFRHVDRCWVGACGSLCLGVDGWNAELPNGLRMEEDTQSPDSCRCPFAYFLLFFCDRRQRRPAAGRGGGGPPSMRVNLKVGMMVICGESFYSNLIPRSPARPCCAAGCYRGPARQANSMPRGAGRGTNGSGIASSAGTGKETSGAPYFILPKSPRFGQHPSVLGIYPLHCPPDLG